MERQWLVNTYPGVACDVPAHIYTFPFAPNPNWSAFVSSVMNDDLKMCLVPDSTPLGARSSSTLSRRFPSINLIGTSNVDIEYQTLNGTKSRGYGSCR